MRYLLTLSSFVASLVVSFFVFSNVVFAQTPTTRPYSKLVSPSPSASPVESPTPTPKPVLTQETIETIKPLEKLLQDQKLGPVWQNPVKYAIRNSVSAGVPANTIVLLLLLPIVAFVVAASRHIIGLRGFGIFLPAALSVVFVATGPVTGIAIFLIITTISLVTRWILKKINLRLQYLPRMSLILWAVSVGVLGILFLAPVVKRPEIIGVSIFPILILVLLAEDFTRVQLGKSVQVALNLTIETLILSLISYFFLTLKPLQEYALLNPEITLGIVAIADILIGRFVGLRMLEFWRFRKLINQ